MNKDNSKIASFVVMAGSISVWALFIWLLVAGKPKALVQHVSAPPVAIPRH